MATQAYAYVRVSGSGQLQGTGPRRQHDTIRAYADKHGVEIVAEYRDAHTGTEADRPEFMRMLADMMADGVRVVLVECLDRLARDLMIQNTLLAKLESEGITLVSATTGENVTAAMRDDPMRRALVQIQGVFAELDKRLLVGRLRRAREARRRDSGRCEGNKPFGHYPGEQETLKRIKQLRRKGRGKRRLSVAKVAGTLNAEGRTNRAGRPWTRGNLWVIMRRAGIP